MTGVLDEAEVRIASTILSSFLRVNGASEDTIQSTLSKCNSPKASFFNNEGFSAKMEMYV
jgi:hypothetical protein